MGMELTSSLEVVKGVGPSLAAKLESLGLETVQDLLLYFPRRYQDFSEVETIKALKPGTVTIRAQIKEVKGRYVRRGMHITEAVASDDTGSVRLVWFNQPYRADQTKTDTDYYINGKFELSRQRLAIMNPAVELVSDFPVNTARIIPIYREAKGIKSNQIRRLIRECAPMIEQLPELLPSWLVKQEKLISRRQALLGIHFPKDADELDRAKQRLSFEEVFELSLASLLNKYDLLKTKSLGVPFNQKLAQEFVGHLPFKLTDGQRAAVWQIYQDMQKTQPMNRLLEGDVGAGKTVVATMAALMALEQGFQVALMAPTELLARQHAETIFKLLEPLGYSDQVGLLIGSLKPAAKKLVQQRVADGTIRFIIGTHALIQDKVDVHKLALVIIDEQHRFGVEQRKALQAKAGHMPHVLNMTATPIPRSLALTLYGDLDISLLAKKPQNRKPIETELVSPNSRKQMTTKIKMQLQSGRQMFVVAPLVSDSSKIDAESAEALYERLRKGDFKEYRIGLLHGRLPAEEKNQVMQKFATGQLDILAATTVIEVGVDVPNATVMVVENADRFGLAQIHQLRGRVGRSEHQGYAYLMLSDAQAPSPRLRALEQSDDGFKLAELDLELRGPGAIYGTMQHGVLDLRIAQLSDTTLIARARQAAQQFIDRGQSLLDYKELYEHVTAIRSVTNLN